MFIMGIRIPFREPSWEENDAFAEQGETHRHCDASECLCPGGRQEAEEQGPWELLLCSSCGAEGTHRHCSGLRDSITSWECDNCAGQSIRRHCCGTTACTNNCDCDSCAEYLTSSGEFSILARLMEESPAVSTEHETITPSTSQQAASEQSLESPSEEMSSPSPYSQVTSRPSHSNIPETEGSSCSRSRGPDRRQNRTCRQSRPPNPHPRSRSPRDSSHVPEPTAARRRPRQGQSGTSPRRKRSRWQSRPQNPHLRYPSPCDRRCSPDLRSPILGGRHPAAETAPAGNVGRKIHAFGPEVAVTGPLCQHQVLRPALPARKNRGHPAGKIAPAAKVGPQIHPTGPEVPVTGTARQHRVLGDETQGRQQPGPPKGKTTPTSSVGPQIHPADPEVAVTGGVIEPPVLGAPLTAQTVRQGLPTDSSMSDREEEAPKGREPASTDDLELSGPSMA
ncbi:nascent polypeptide-associated complex subunit alpha, muscle-specific form-like [Neopelma chrysocephalum]|uniref:nascent polypeptide-associated complex subunit alpha, muscle-specific form-like n=1 Tax=Neopelma chrysocephalum TaxID=114329 RepID=UPI000FCD01E6|nr:nascent polypeptide-associated complex subunit alpha, muscle-specific form-like [Neopelma chrysocephalum]